MKRLVSGSVYVLAGALAGAISALVGIDSLGTFAAAPGSPWQGRSVTLAGRAHPYALAHFLTAGRLPPALGQIREFAAQRSNDGAALVADCHYVLTSADTDTPHWWTLVTMPGSGGKGAGLISSDTAIADADGQYRISMSRLPSPGNWLPTPPTGAFTLVYTLADPATVSRKREPPGFRIERTGC